MVPKISQKGTKIVQNGPKMVWLRARGLCAGAAGLRARLVQGCVREAAVRGAEAAQGAALGALRAGPPCVRGAGLRAGVRGGLRGLRAGGCARGAARGGCARKAARGGLRAFSWNTRARRSRQNFTMTKSVWIYAHFFPTAKL